MRGDRDRRTGANQNNPAAVHVSEGERQLQAQRE